MPKPRGVTKGMKMNTLTTFQNIKLADWVRLEFKNYDGKTDDFFAHAATDALGFKVNSPQVSRMCKELNIPRQKGLYGWASQKVKHAGALQIDLIMVIEELLKFANRHLVLRVND